MKFKLPYRLVVSVFSTSADSKYSKVLSSLKHFPSYFKDECPAGIFASAALEGTPDFYFILFKVRETLFIPRDIGLFLSQAEKIERQWLRTGDDRQLTLDGDALFLLQLTFIATGEGIMLNSAACVFVLTFFH